MHSVKPLVVIGGGPAGYVAAITAARQGKQVTLIEQKDLGGTCLNEGCMPTKSLLASAEAYEKIKKAEQFGITIPLEQVKINWDGVQHHKTTIVKNLVRGIGYLMKKNSIKVIKGEASFLTNHRLSVRNENHVEEIEAEQFIIAAGSEPASLPFAPFDGKWIIHSKQAMSLPAIPSTLLIVGGGVIGCEFASIYSQMGTTVTIVEAADQLLPGEDADIAFTLQEELEKKGVAIYTSSSLTEMQPEDKTALFKHKEELHELQAEYALISIGRKPRVLGLGLEQVGVHFSKQGIDVNEHMQTNIPNIYACGDVVGGIQLAHVAFHEGTVAALHACGKDKSVNYRAVPRCIYTHPEIASVGMTEKQARSEYGDIRVGEFSFTANGKAMIANESIGKVKVIVEPQFNEIIGLSIVGSHATELIGQGTIMMHGELTTDIMEDFIAAHPTLSEAIHEALLQSAGQAVHS